MGQEANIFFGAKGHSRRQCFPEYANAFLSIGNSEALQRKNAAVNSQNEAVRLGIEAVNFRNEVVESTDVA